MENKIEIYKDKKSGIEIDVNFDKDTVWLDQSQMSMLFNRERSVITKHINNIFKEKELERKSNVQNLHIAKSDKPIKLYSLDVIISVGYRVKSLRGTQFRIWATNVLKKYLIEGYVINKKMLEEKSLKLEQLQTYLKTLKKVVTNEDFTLDTSKALMRIIADYGEEINLFPKIDNKSLKIPKNTSKRKVDRLGYSQFRKEIDNLKERLKASEIFGQEKDDGFKSAIKTIFQSFDKKDLYPSIEEKAVNLLYLIIKNHAFVDGNKRIGSYMFLRFLDLCGILYKSDGTKLIDESALVAIALLIAQSDTRDKDMIVTLVVNLIVNE